MFLELLVHIVEQLLNLLARKLVLLVEAGADAEMKRFFRLFLLRTLLKARTFSTETKFDHFAHLWHILTTLRNDALHIAALSAN